MPLLVIAKLGGSALTDKKSFETLKEDVLRKITDQVQSVLEKDDIERYIVLVHGAGSFGHFQAREFSIRQGGRNDSWLEGFAATRLSVTRLNHHVVSSCVASRIRAVGVSPFPHTHCSPGKSCELEPDGVALATAVAESLRWGLVPVIHGDAVLSMAPHRCTILSGDTLMLWLARHLPEELGVSAVRCVFLTDVEGVYSSFDPATGKGSGDVIKMVQVDADGTLRIPHLITTGGADDKRRADVTGGLNAKLEAAAAIAVLGIPVYITKAGSSSCLQAFNGESPMIGTCISLSRDDI